MQSMVRWWEGLRVGSEIAGLRELESRGQVPLGWITWVVRCRRFDLGKMQLTSW